MHLKNSSCRYNLLLIAAGLVIFSSAAFYVQGSKTSPALSSVIDTVPWPASFGVGRVAQPHEITAWDIDVRPDGKGLPPGRGTAAEGKVIYAAKCAACHGANGTAVAGVKLPGPVLVGDTAFIGRKQNTIGSYWPYATTIFDYVRRSMPYNAPLTLTDNEVYALTAYLLSENKIIAPREVMNAQTLPKVIMPAKKFFITDDRKGGSEIK